MKATEIYKLASEMTEQQVMNVIGGWESNNENEKLKTYSSLVRLGDSKQLACATIILSTPISDEEKEFYRNAYEK